MSASNVMNFKCDIIKVHWLLVRKLSQKCGSLTSTDISRHLDYGLFAVNKPKDISSTEVVENIKSVILPAIPADLQDSFKVGHGGVLDRTASGVLAIGVGRGCKLLPKFLHGFKEYIVTGQLGISTTTYNETGEVTKELPYGHVTKECFLRALVKFRGKVSQTPPVYSALKLHGRRYSDLAREGKEVIPEPRLVKCHSLICTRFDPPMFTLLVKCGGGFYIRSLVHDLGMEVGSCAHVQALHRTQHGLFKEYQAISRDQWNLQCIIQHIQKAKKSYKNLFEDSLPKDDKSERRYLKEDRKPEKSIVFTEDMFDL